MSRKDFIRDYTPPSRQPAIAEPRAVDRPATGFSLSSRLGTVRHMLFTPARELLIAVEKSARTGHSEGSEAHADD
jgi:hypothetical protein